MFFESFLLNLAVLGILIIALIFDYVTKFFSYWYVRHIPNNACIPFFGSDYFRILGVRNTTDEVNSLYAQFPKEKFVGSVKSRIPDLIVKDKDDIKTILSTDSANFHSRGLGLDKSQDICLRNNLFYANGEKWTVLREGLESMLDSTDTGFKCSLQDCLSGTNGDVNVQQLLSNILDSAFTVLLLGSDGDTAVIRKIRTILQQRSLKQRLVSYLKSIFPSMYVLLGLETLPGQPCLETLKTLDGSKLISEVNKIKSALHSNDKKGKRQLESDSKFAFSILTTFITEGYVPCLNLLTALFYELANNPDVQRRVQKDEKEYLDKVIKETLRLHSPFSVITRQCVKTFKFETGLLIDKNVTVNVPVEAIHRDENNFENATSFNPDRFGDEKESLAFLPYGQGPKKCIGEKLSQDIVRSVTREILGKYQIGTCDRTPAHLPVTDYNFQRVVSQDIWLKFVPRPQ